jgi:hypothetical protein
MSTNHEQQMSLLQDSDAELMRVTLFPSPSSRESSESWWVEVMGAEPEERQIRPRQAIVNEQGDFNKGRLTLSSQATRTDWIWQAREFDTDTVPGPPVLGRFINVVGDFRALVYRWFDLQTCPDARRLAFAGTVSIPVVSLESGHQLLANYLPTVDFGDGSGYSDLVFQINRQRPSEVMPDLQINRLSRWSVGTWTTTRWVPPASIEERGRGYRVQVQFDFNSVAEYDGVISTGDLRGLLDELVDLVRALLKEGDK